MIDNAIKGLGEYIAQSEITPGNRILRDEQLLVLRAIWIMLQKGERDGYIKLPTGVGKTVIFIEFLRATGLKSLVVVPTNVLTDQTVDKIAYFGQDTMDVGVVNYLSRDYERLVTVTTYASLIRQVKNGSINPSDYDCLIMDEAHYALGPESSVAIEGFRGKIRLGFTATPDYSPTKRLIDILPNEVASMSVRSAIEDNLLAGCSVLMAKTSADISQVSIQAGNYREDELEKALNIAARNQGAVQVYQELFSDQKALAYCVSIKHAEELARVFRSEGVAAVAVSSKQDRRERVDALKQFSDGTIEVLCNADLLIFGFDDPAATVCLNLRPTLSWVVAEQRAGRVLRRDPNNPLKMASIVEFLDKDEGRRSKPVLFSEILNGAYLDSSGSVSNQINPLGGNGPGNRPAILEISGIRVITDAEMVMSLTKKQAQERKAQKGWLNQEAFEAQLINGFNDLLGCSGMASIKGDYLSDLQTLYPRYHHQHRMLTIDAVVSQYSPELARAIFKEYQDIPWLWTEMKEIALRFGASKKVIECITEEYCRSRSGGIYIKDPSDPDKFDNYYLPRLLLQGRRAGHAYYDGATYYSPKLVRHIEHILSQHQDERDQCRDQEGWVDFSGLRMRLVGVSCMPRLRKDIQDYFDRSNVRCKHPFWFRDVLNIKGNEYREEYAPPLVEALSGIFTKKKILQSFLDNPRWNGVYVLSDFCRGNGFNMPVFEETEFGRAHRKSYRCYCKVDYRGEIIDGVAQAKKKGVANNQAAQQVFTKLIKKILA